MDFRRLRAWLEHFSMRWVGLPLEELGWEAPPEQQGLHASGHADAKSLMKAVLEVGPRILIPIHTERQGIEYFQHRVRAAGVRVDVPAYGTPVDLERIL